MTAGAARQLGRFPAASWTGHEPSNAAWGYTMFGKQISISEAGTLRALLNGCNHWIDNYIVQVEILLPEFWDSSSGAVFAGESFIGLEMLCCRVECIARKSGPFLGYKQRREVSKRLPGASLSI